MIDKNTLLRILDLVERDGRFDYHAYVLVLNVLDSAISKEKITQREHVDCQTFARMIAEFAKDTYGAFAGMVLESWGVHSTEDMGQLVFSLAGAQLLALSSEDSIESFNNVFDFADVFDGPFSAEPPFPDMPVIRW